MNTIKSIEDCKRAIKLFDGDFYDDITSNGSVPMVDKYFAFMKRNGVDLGLKPDDGFFPDISKKTTFKRNKKKVLNLTAQFVFKNKVFQWKHLNWLLKNNPGK